MITSLDSKNNNIDIVGQGCGSGSSGGTHQDLTKILILVVGMEALNDNIRSKLHHHSGNVTRIYCVHLAILCLSRLPSDLTASDLAHGRFSI